MRLARELEPQQEAGYGVMTGIWIGQGPAVSLSSTAKSPTKEALFVLHASINPSHQDSHHDEERVRWHAEHSTVTFSRFTAPSNDGTLSQSTM